MNKDAIMYEQNSTDERKSECEKCDRIQMEFC